MKTQLKTIALAAVLLSLVAGFSTAMSAQSVSTLHFGGNMSNFTGNSTAFEYESLFKLGFQIGFTQTYGSFLQLEPGIFFINKGTKFYFDSYFGNDLPRHPTDNRAIRHLNYLQIPINLKVNFGDEKLRFVAGIGVYGSVRLKKLINSSYNSSLFDFGGQILGGVQYGRFGVNVGWQPGFSSIYKKENIKNQKIYNNTFFFGLSYIINKNEY